MRSPEAERAVQHVSFHGTGGLITYSNSTSGLPIEYKPHPTGDAEIDIVFLVMPVYPAPPDDIAAPPKSL